MLLKLMARQLSRTVSPAGSLVAAMLMLPDRSSCQTPIKTVPDGTEGVVHIIRPMDSLAKKLPPNEFEGSVSTFKIGLGYILDGTTYAQSAVFKQQMDSAGLIFKSKVETRDFRLLLSGVFKTKRTIAWKFAYMFDGDDKVWMVRESGVTVGVPELAGHIFIGRTKECYSLVKVMNSHSPWT